MDKDNEKLGPVLSRYSMAERAKREIVPIKKLAMALYLDSQFSYINKKGAFATITDDELKRLRNSKKQYPLFFNLCKPAAKVVASQITQRRPKMIFHPKGSVESTYSAQAANDGIRYYFENQKMQKKDVENALMFSICGDSYQWTHPIDGKGGYVDEPKLDEMGNPMVDEQGMPITERIPTDFDFTTTNVRWDQFYPAPGVDEIEDMPWLFIKRYLDRTVVNDAYNAKLEENISDRAETHDPNAVIKGDTSALPGERIGDQVMVLDYFEKPSKKNKKGRHMVIAYEEGVILDDGEFPYWKKGDSGQPDEWGGYRIQHYVFDPGLITHWGQSLFSPVVDIQKAINHILTAYRTNVTLTLTLKLLYPDNVDFSDDFLSNEPKPIKYPAEAQPPRWMETVRIPTDIKDFLMLLISQFNEIIGLHTTSMGGEPEKRMPFLAIQYLNETDIVKFKPTFDMYADAYCRVAWDVVDSIRQYRPKWFLRALGDNRMLEFDSFMKDDFADYDIMVERESYIPESKAGRTATILQILKDTGGAAFDLTSPAGRAALWGVLDTGWSKDLTERAREATKLAQEENRLLLNNEVPEVSEYHMHPEHIREHLRLFNSLDYLNKVKDSSIGVNAAAHIKEHLAYEVQGDNAQVVSEVEKQAMGQQTAAALMPQPVMNPPVNGGNPAGGQGEGGEPGGLGPSAQGAE